MRRILGVILLVAGLFFAYCFGASGAYHGRDLPGTSFSVGLALKAMGGSYPGDVLFFLAMLWGFGLGLRIVLERTPDPAAPPQRGGPVVRLVLLNALLLLSSLFAAYIGGRARQSVAAVAVFGIVALLQVLGGLALLVMAAVEKPRSIVRLAAGGAVYALGVGVTFVALTGGN